MTQFDIDYKHGKESEIISLPDLRKVFGEDLILDDEMFAHFDYFKDNLMAELKTRDDIVFKDGEFHYTTRRGKKMILDSIYFDAVKMRFAFQHNKKRKDKKRFFMIWKCNGEYFYWELNWDKIEYFIEEQDRDFGHGFKQVRDVINVKVEYIKPLSSISL
tara:strand:- start:1945 stop:2424 length:480 start_codon:yes stop_codon:yes gene_type:complete